MKKSINWWWFFLVSGILLPALFVLILQDFYLPYLHQFFIRGFNPILLFALNLFIIFFVCLLFKLIDKTILNNPVKKIIYIVTGIVCVYFFANAYFKKTELNMTNETARRYLVIQESAQSEERLSKYYFVGYSVFIIILFLFFFVKNFPFNNMSLKKTTL